MPGWFVQVLDGIFIDKDTFLLNVLPLAILAVAVMKAAFSYGQNYLMNLRRQPGDYGYSRTSISPAHAAAGRFHDSNTSGPIGVPGDQ